MYSYVELLTKLSVVEIVFFVRTNWELSVCL